jgi:alpha-beta hydrolase superfamily lysophospholipase
MAGVRLPRPENQRTPRDVNLGYERHLFPGAHGLPLEAWLIPRTNARGTVVLFHGHAASKDSLLREARVFHDQGFRTLLVDFHGSGGSGGNETSVGFHEARDVTESFRYARKLPDSGPVVLYGGSMGAVAILKAVADDHLDPAGQVLESPFSSLIGTVRHRFQTMGVPSFPLADLLVFWGGVQEGFNGLAFRPEDSAARIQCPTLLMSGDADPWVLPEETSALFGALQGPKWQCSFHNVGHESCLRAQPERWRHAVQTFLDGLLASS